jgi:hypothetical protein
MYRTTAASLSRRQLLQCVAASICLASLPSVKAAPFQEITWEALVPPDWDPTASFRDLQGLGDLPDTDERVQELYERMRKVWDEAPTIASLDGRDVKIPGFIVPLEAGKKGISEFLLVPYFGACIHTPPPPANQIIHVRATPPAEGFETMSAVWVSGTLGLGRSNSEWGMSGYSMKAAHVEEYKER